MKHHDVDRASELFDELRHKIKNEDSDVVRGCVTSMLMFDYCVTHDDPPQAKQMLMQILAWLEFCYEGGAVENNPVRH